MFGSFVTINEQILIILFLTRIHNSDFFVYLHFYFFFSWILFSILHLVILSPRCHLAGISQTFFVFHKERKKLSLKYIYLWLTHVDIWWKTTQYYKAIILQLKINNFLKKENCMEYVSAICNKSFNWEYSWYFSHD